MKFYKFVARSSFLRLVLIFSLIISLTACSEQLTEVDQPVSGTILSGYAPKDCSQITVSLEPTASSVVMLKDESDRVLLSFFVSAGESVTVDVPAEKMYVHFASGKKWYGEEHFFGKDTVYRQDNELTDFTNYSWEYELDPLSQGEFEYNDSGAEHQETVESKITADNYIANLEGNWEEVHLNSGNSSLNVSALAFSKTIDNCTGMTITIDVEMYAGTSCKDWQVWARNGGKFKKVDKIFLPDGNGYVSQVLTFDNPISFDAIAVTPTKPGGYSWALAMGVSDVWTTP